MLKENQIKPLDLTAKTNKYGVIAIRKLDKRRNNSCVWECKCSCGKKFELEADLFEKVKSCGCAATEQAKKQMGKLRKDIEDYYIEGTSVLAIKEKKMLKNNTSGVRGVCYDKRRRKWLAQIGFQGYNYYLGRYDLKEDAIAAREEAEKEKFGNFLEWYASEYPDRWEKLQKTEKHIKSEEI